VIREREETVAREQELDVGVKRRIERVNETVKAQMSVNLKEVTLSRSCIDHS
jgi:hypothetical protein